MQSKHSDNHFLSLAWHSCISYAPDHLSMKPFDGSGSWHWWNFAVASTPWHQNSPTALLAQFTAPAEVKTFYLGNNSLAGLTHVHPTHCKCTFWCILLLDTKESIQESCTLASPCLSVFLQFRACLQLLKLFHWAQTYSVPSASEKTHPSTDLLMTVSSGEC